MTNDDLKSLIESMQQADYFHDRFQRQQEERGVLLAAWQDDGVAVGDVYLWLEPAEEPELRLHIPGIPLITHLEVHEDLRNQKIGTAILRETEQVARELGYRQIALGVGLKNRAVRLYERLGFQEWPHGLVKSPADEFRIFVKALD